LGRKKLNVVTLFTCVKLGNVTAKQDFSALETFNMSKNAELIK